MSDGRQGGYVVVESDVFRFRVRSAARAAWQVFLILILVTVVQYMLYLIVVGSGSEIVARLWLLPPESMARVWAAGILGMKVVCLLVAIAALFLSLWARALARQ
jgi:uncharacterized membrane protein